MAEKNSKYNKRRWSVPSKRAKGYAADRKAKYKKAISEGKSKAEAKAISQKKG